MTESQVFKTLLTLAEGEDGIRAVLMEGSRANPNTVPDKWQDFDIVYVTRANAPYIDGKWVEQMFLPQFGEVAVKQIPDNGDPNLVYTWLIQFANGIRVDLTFNSLEFLSSPNILESATAVLLDKDGRFADVPQPCERDYLPKHPTAQEYLRCCNAFWWVSPYVTKAIAREQTLLAIELLSECVRVEYTQMLVWLAGIATDFSVNLGKHSWKVGKYVPSKFCQTLVKSYPHAELIEIRAALNGLLNAFPTLAGQVADALGFHYDAVEGERTMRFIKDFYKE
jgi:aminoglycoside 6-adenylyltransferase